MLRGTSGEQFLTSKLHSSPRCHNSNRGPKVLSLESSHLVNFLIIRRISETGFVKSSRAAGNASVTMAVLCDLTFFFVTRACPELGGGLFVLFHADR